MMRSTVDRITLLITLALVLGALVFAWSRTDRRDDRAAARSDASVPEPWRVVGERLFGTECSSCHPRGEGLGSSIPPVRGRAAEMASSSGGRQRLIDLLLTGNVTGDDGVPEAVHPDVGHLSDEEISALLNYSVMGWGDETTWLGAPFAPAEIHEMRSR